MNLFWNAEAANYILLDEVLHLAVTDLMKGFGLYPLGEIVGDRKHVHLLAWGHWEFTDDVHSPLYEGPRGDDGGELLRWKMSYLRKALAAITLLNKGDGVRPHGRPVVASR